jgi:TetR/AcrR family transcriptional regulator, ethionamide resistance regulator
MPAIPYSSDGKSPAVFTRLAGPGRLRDGTTEVEQRIFAATEELLTGTSLADLRVEDIATAAGISRRTFYAYFPSKGAVLTKLAANLIAQGSEYFWPVREPVSGETGRQALRRTVESNCRLWTEIELPVVD